MQGKTAIKGEPVDKREHIKRERGVDVKREQDVDVKPMVEDHWEYEYEDRDKCLGESLTKHKCPHCRKVTVCMETPCVFERRYRRCANCDKPPSSDEYDHDPDFHG